MKLSRKIEKLVSLEAFQSLREHARRWTHPVAAGPIIERLDPVKWKQLREEYPEGPGHPKINRFANAAKLIKESIERAQDLWLDKSPPLRILDLGGGPNYFLFVCNFFGHQGLAVDIDEQPLFRDTSELLGVPRVIHRIEARTPLPDLGGKFDLITAHRVCFYKKERNEAGRWHEWDTADWKFFLDDVRRNQLKPGGRLLLDFNPRPGERRFMTPEVRQVLLDSGARIFRSKALLAQDPAVSPKFRI